VWYVGYGSNLCEERFLCYIRGGKFKWGGSNATRCTDQSLPKGNKSCWVPYRLYFAKESSCWEGKGVAFINPNRESDKNNWTLGRMWKITREQYEHIRNQEGRSRYNHEIPLGKEDGITIYTITNAVILTPYNRPSAGYLKTIALGLKETDNWTNEKILQYLKEKPGVNGQVNEDELINIIESATSSNPHFF
jgi:hypothetical protein